GRPARPADLNLAVHHPGLEPRLIVDRGPSDHTAAAEVEPGAVPWTNDDVAVADAFVERAAEVAAGGGDGAQLARLASSDQHVGSVDRDPVQLPVAEVVFASDGHEVPGAPVPEGLVDADPEPEAELASDVGGRRGNPEPERAECPAEAAPACSPV